MTLTKRTDIHRPSAVIPTDYEFVGLETVKIMSLGDCIVVDDNRKRIRAHMARTGGTYSRHEHGGNCHICGAHCIYTIIYYHAPTNSYIRTGSDCADKLDMAWAREDMNAFKTAIKEAGQLQAGKKKAQTILSEHDLDAAWAIYLAQREQYVANYEETTIDDIVRKVISYGSISNSQVNFVRSLLTRINDRAVIEAKRQAEKEAALPVPTGRIEVTGVVIGTKSVENYYGYGDILKMTVMSDDGWKVFGTIPDSLLGNTPVKGCRVRFTATIEASTDDAKFGFFKRPTKATILEVPQEAA